jgi:GntR family phosphonate transport system transcriptional regulator
MTRTPVWKSIADTLAAEITNGHYGTGDKLPTEAALATRFGVNRHTVRRALGDMAETGLVHARRGSGVYVTQTPADYPIGKRVRFHHNLMAAGRLPARRILSLETRAAAPIEAEALALATGDPVHVCEGISLADGQPLAHFISVFPALPFPDLPDHLRALGSVTAALRASGLSDYTRASTRFNATLATATQALHLRTTEGAALLRTVSLNVDSHGTPVEFGQTWFVGDRVTLTLADASPPLPPQHGTTP